MNSETPAAYEVLHQPREATIRPLTGRQETAGQGRDQVLTPRTAISTSFARLSGNGRLRTSWNRRTSRYTKRHNINQHCRHHLRLTNDTLQPPRQWPTRHQRADSTCPIPCHTVSASSDGSPSLTQPCFRHPQVETEHAWILAASEPRRSCLRETAGHHVGRVFGTHTITRSTRPEKLRCVSRLARGCG